MSATFFAKDKTCASCRYWNGERCVPSAFSRTVTVTNGYNKEEICSATRTKTKPSNTCSNWNKMDKVNM